MIDSNFVGRGRGVRAEEARVVSWVGSVVTGSGEGGERFIL